MNRLAVLILVGITWVPLLPQETPKLKPKPGITQILASPNGRFVFGQFSEMRADQFLLDTQTGRMWQRTEATSPVGKGSITVIFVPVAFQKLDGSLVDSPL